MASASAACSSLPSTETTQLGLSAEHRSAFGHITDGAFSDIDGACRP
jgi:hypothetical protein